MTGQVGGRDPVDVMLPAAAALAVAVSEVDRDAVAEILTPLTIRQLYGLAIALAANVDLDRPLRVEAAPPPLPETATRAVGITAELFSTTPLAILSTDRHQNVADARAVAMAALRLLGISSPRVGAHFERDHSTVLYAATRVGESQRLRRLSQYVAAECGWVRESEVA